MVMNQQVVDGRWRRGTVRGAALALLTLVLLVGCGSSSSSDSNTKKPDAAAGGTTSSGGSATTTDGGSTTTGPSTTSTSAVTSTGEAVFKFLERDSAAALIRFTARCPDGSEPSGVEVPYLGIMGGETTAVRVGDHEFTIAITEFGASNDLDAVLLELDLEKTEAPSAVFQATCP